MKFKELVLSYRIPAKLLQNSPIESASVSLVGRNLFFLYRNTENFDPELASYSAGNACGYKLPLKDERYVNWDYRGTLPCSLSGYDQGNMCRIKLA